MRNSILKLFHYFFKLNRLILGSGGDYRWVHSFLIHTGQNVLKLIPGDFVFFFQKFCILIPVILISYFVVQSVIRTLNEKSLAVKRGRRAHFFSVNFWYKWGQREQVLCVIFICVCMHSCIHSYTWVCI